MPLGFDLDLQSYDKSTFNVPGLINHTIELIHDRVVEGGGLWPVITMMIFNITSLGGQQQ